MSYNSVVLGVTSTLHAAGESELGLANASATGGRISLDPSSAGRATHHRLLRTAGRDWQAS